MKWINHKITATATAMAIGMNVIETVFVAIGSYLPDYIEMAIARNNKELWKKVHRKICHWWIIYLVYIIIASLFADNYIINISRFIAVGAYMHIIGDAMTVQGIPILNPYKCDLAMGYFKTGEDKEYKYTLIYTAIMTFIIVFFTGFNLKDFMLEDNQRINFMIQNGLQSFENLVKSFLN